MIRMKRKYKKNNKFNIHQTSFYFEDFLESNNKSKFTKKNNYFQDRIYLLFFLFFSLIFIFGIRIVHVSMNKVEVFNFDKSPKKFSLLRRDIVDRNNELISRNVMFFHAAIRPSLINNKDNFLIKLRLLFPELPIEDIKMKMFKGKYFYIKKRINQSEKEKLWSLGEKGLVFEPFQTGIFFNFLIHQHL